MQPTVVPQMDGSSTVYRIPLGRLALSAGVARQVLSFRRHLEVAVAAANGGLVTLWQARKIRSAAVAMAEAKRAQAKLAGGNLSEEQQMGWSDRLVKHEAACDRACESLGLHIQVNSASNFFDNFYREQQHRQAEQLALLANGNSQGRSDGHPSPPDAADAKPEGKDAQ